MLGAGLPYRMINALAEKLRRLHRHENRDRILALRQTVNLLDRQRWIVRRDQDGVDHARIFTSSQCSIVQSLNAVQSAAAQSGSGKPAQA